MPVSIDYRAIAPEIIVSVAIATTLVLDLFLRRHRPARVASGLIAFLSLVAALGAVIANVGAGPTETLAGLFVLDGFALVTKGLFCAAGAFVVWVSVPPMRGHRYEGEYYFLILCTVLGTMLMPSSRDLLTLFIALELVSVPGFIIAGIRKHNPRSNEAALKFFIFGVLSAAIFAYGISIVYGFAGTTSLQGIAEAVRAGDGPPETLLLTGIVMIIAAFGFKVSAVPFHFWAPDTYEGSPTPLAAYLSVSSKAAGFVGLLLILLVGFGDLASSWGPIVGAIAAATMTVGNVLALKQRHLVRLLAYSSIGHAGYMLIPLALIQPFQGNPLAGTNGELVRSLVTYLVIYAVMNLGVFAVAIGLSKQYPTLLIRDLAGLNRRAPMTAFATAGFMISLGGIPPFAGWFAKFAIFLAAVNTGSPLGVVLAAIMVVNSVISLYYYLGVVRAVYLTPPEEDVALRAPLAVTMAVAICAAAVLVIGVFPEPLVRLAQAARIALF